MKVSLFLDWQVNVGMDYSWKWAKIFDIEWEELEKVRLGATMKEDWSILENEDYFKNLKEKKKGMCRDKIESKYKIHDQVNTILFGTTEEINTMKAYLSWVLTEYRTKWKDADFSKFSS